MTEIDIDQLKRWIGKTEERQESLSVERAVSLAATLDHETRPNRGDVVPPLWHWVFFVPDARQSELGVDGHPKLGRFMPPVPLPRRMWVGGRLEFRSPIHLGDNVSRRSEIVDIASKVGKNGPLVFVTLRHELRASGTSRILEEQDLVYRPADSPSAGVSEKPNPSQEIAEELEADWREYLTPDPTLLFRYSAVTFNAHRIHYDARYASEEENYPGLVVHGPLTATLLADRLMRQAGGRLAEFHFRAVRPLFCGQEMRLCGKRGEGDQYQVWAETPTGQPAMTATAVIGEQI